MGFKTWTEAARIAVDRKRWKDTIKSPILQVEWGIKRESARNMCESILAANIPPANPRQLIQDESRGPGICKRHKTYFIASCRNFWRRSEVGKEFQTPLFWNIDHKIPIKIICFVFIRSECLVSWPYSPWDHMAVHVPLIYPILYIGLMDWGTGHLTITE